MHAKQPASKLKQYVSTLPPNVFAAYTQLLEDADDTAVLPLKSEDGHITFVFMDSLLDPPLNPDGSVEVSYRLHDKIYDSDGNKIEADETSALFGIFTESDVEKVIAMLVDELTSVLEGNVDENV